MTIRVDPSHATGAISPYLTGECIEDVNHEIYGGIYSQMIFGESFQEPAGGDGVSKMWRPVVRGEAAGQAAISTENPFVGKQSQQITFASGTGEFGIENRGLNRQGIAVLAGREYRGHLWARGQTPAALRVRLASADGARLYALTDLSAVTRDWRRYDFSLTPDASDTAGRFEVTLGSPGEATIGYVFLEPGEWGLFHRQPVRRDVAELMQAEGVKFLRLGGSMVNAAGYRWKNTIGPRDRRPPYEGHWYPYSSNGWGIPEFLNFCQAAGFVGIPDVNINESPGDLADLIEYANGPADSPWGARRVAAGHAEPYGLRYLELGNEERIDDEYYAKFAAIARAVWGRDPNIVLIAGDFRYTQPITDPLHFSGADSGITSLAAHAKIMALAKQLGGQAWFDVHVFTEGPRVVDELAALKSYVDAIDKLADGARHHVVVFELNANSHNQQRALCNARAILFAERDGRIPFMSSANALQVDHQNDNAWDQGLLFMNPSMVWLQPPGFIWQMVADHFLPTRVACDTDGATEDFDAVATSGGGDGVVLQVMNAGDNPVAAKLEIAGRDFSGAQATVTTLAGDLSDSNTAEAPQRIHPVQGALQGSDYLFPQHSFTVVRWNR